MHSINLAAVDLQVLKSSCLEIISKAKERYMQCIEPEFLPQFVPCRSVYPSNHTQQAVIYAMVAASEILLLLFLATGISMALSVSK